MHHIAKIFGLLCCGLVHYHPAKLQTNIYNVDGDLDESIKRNASDRLGDLVPQVRARTSPGVFRDMALLGLCLELSFYISRRFVYQQAFGVGPLSTQKDMYNV